MGWHWCDDAANDQHTLTDGGVVNWSVQAVLWPAGDEGALSTLGRANHCHYYGRRLQRRPVHHRQVELPGLHVQAPKHWTRM